MIRLLLWENNSMFCIRSRSIISLELHYPGEEQQLDIQSSRQTAYCVSSLKKNPAWPKYLLTAWFLPFSQISWFCHIFAVLLNRFPSFAPYLPFLTKHSQKCVTQSFGNHILTLLWGLRGFISTINLTKHIFFPPSTSFDNHMFFRGWIIHSAWELFSNRAGSKVQEAACLGFGLCHVPPVSPGADLWRSRLTASITSSSSSSNFHTKDLSLNPSAAAQTHHNSSALQQQLFGNSLRSFLFFS